MHQNNLVKNTLLCIGLLFCNILFSQDTIPPASDRDSTDVDTIVIRAEQIKIRNIPRGAHLTNPVISFHNTKPLSKPFERFRIPSFWDNENLLGLSLSEVAFVNWNAGGDNSITALGKVNLSRNYKFRYIQWNNDLELKFGWNAQEGRKWRKTDDVIRLSSTFGFRRDTISNWYYSAKASFNTQFADGFKYPDRISPISRFTSPGYLFLGAGTSYITEEGKFNLYISPLTHKSTFVLDRELANNGAFGVKKAVLDTEGNVVREGEHVFVELGFLINTRWETQVTKNVLLNSRLSFYTDYLRSFGNIDVDGELTLNLTVNDRINATIGTHVIYDDDILFEQQEASDGTILDPGEPRIQFKQILGIGVVYSL